MPKGDLPRHAHCVHAGQQRGYFHRVLSVRPCVHHTNLQQVIWHKAWTGSQQAVPPLWKRHPTVGEQSPYQGQPPLSIYRRQCPKAKGEAQTRKPDGQGLMACPPGLTADTTVFAIGRDAEMKVRMARRQGIASRGCLRSGICCTLALNALGGRFRFVWRCLKSTGASTLPKSLVGLKSDSQ